MSEGLLTGIAPQANRNGGGSGLKRVLQASEKTISGNTSYTFIPYRRSVLPLDKFIFWIKALDLKELTIQGSCHVDTVAHQKEEGNYDLSNVTFNCFNEIREFKDAPLDVVYMGEFKGIKYAIGRRSPFYENASEYHYVGQTLTPPHIKQFIDGPDELPKGKVVSNSLPAFLEMANDSNPYVAEADLPEGMIFYPSFLVIDNQVPPYATIHNEPAGLSEVGAINDQTYPGVFVKERVRITTYGLSHEELVKLRTRVIRYGIMRRSIGISNAPPIIDDKEGLAEIDSVAMRKTIEFDVNYWQGQMTDIGKNTIEKATIAIKKKV